MTTVCVFYSAYQVCRHGLAKLLETCGLPQDTPVWKRIDGFDFAVGTKQALDDSLPSPSGDWEQVGAVCNYWQPYPRFSKYAGDWVPVDKYLPELYDGESLCVLVAAPGWTRPQTGFLTQIDDGLVWYVEGMRRRVAHWQSLPAMPK